jgi:DNA polymerase-3 subunit chi
MVQVAFYQLRNSPLERALPKLLEKVVSSGARAVLLGGSEERIDALNAALWTYDQDTFLPHGSARDGNVERQPIYLTSAFENPNDASILVLIDGQNPAEIGAFERCFDMFDGTDATSLEAARARWKAHKAAGHEVTYWEQTDGGKWSQRA